jgi:predicted MFS family arabinose efflux permease
VGVFGRLFHLVWGAEVDRALRPVLAVNLAGSIAGSAGFTFVGIWATKELGAERSDLGIAFLIGAFVSAFGGYLGGHLSDYVGRRPLILIGWGGSALYWLGFVVTDASVFTGLAYIACAGILFGLSGGVSQAMVADLVPPEKHEAAYASVRVAANLGVTLGPPVGGLFLLIGGWTLEFVGVGLLAGFAFFLAYRYLPRGGTYAPEGPPQRGSFGVIARDKPFLLFLASGILAWLVYVAFEVVLPVSLTNTHGLAPAAWGFLVIVNPVMVTFFQLRLTRRVEHVPPAVKLAVAMPLMGLPFLLLSVSAAIPVVMLVIFLFVIGEMLWVPTSQSVVAGLAPADLRGAYMGVFGSGAATGFALAPFFGLSIGDRYGDSTMWAFFACVSILAGIFGAIAARGVQTRPESEGLERDPRAGDAAVA